MTFWSMNSAQIFNIALFMPKFGTLDPITNINNDDDGIMMQFSRMSKYLSSYVIHDVTGQ